VFKTTSHRLNTVAGIFTFWFGCMPYLLQGVLAKGFTFCQKTTTSNRHPVNQQLLILTAFGLF
jgi:hypothetical protein